MHAYRAALLRFDDAGRPLYDTDGLLVVGPGPGGGVRTVQAAGAWSDLAGRYAHVPVQHLPGRLIAPGFVDLHVHYPQIDVIGSPAEGLLPWLERYTFPQEARFADPAHARTVAAFFLDELARHGVTTALTFATSHPGSVDALMDLAQPRGLRLIAGMPHDRVERLLARGTKGTVRRLAIARHTESGLLEHTPNALRLSQQGRLLASEVAIDLL